jgi:hypothetical protein
MPPATVYFTSGSATLSQESMATIQQVAANYRSAGNATVTLTGHTDTQLRAGRAPRRTTSPSFGHETFRGRAICAGSSPDDPPADEGAMGAAPPGEAAPMEVGDDDSTESAAGTSKRP